MSLSNALIRRHNKKLRRNLEGLLSKCYKYGELKGVNLGLYIEYTDKDEFVSYESNGFCHTRISSKVTILPNPASYRSSNWCRKRNPHQRTISLRTWSAGWEPFTPMASTS